MTVNPHDSPRWKAVQNIYNIYNYIQLGVTAENPVTSVTPDPNLSKNELKNNDAIVLQRDSNT